MLTYSPGDEAMGGVYGEFIPTANPYSRVQQTVWKLGASASADYPAWHTLALNAQLENGYFLFPAGGYEIADAAEFPDELKRIYLVGIAAEILQDFIKTDPPRTFVEEPWEALTILQKLALEAELTNELGSSTARLSGVTTNSRVATGPLFSALCKFGPSDDVLFSIRSTPGLTSQFALVHLTWSGSQEIGNSFPRVCFFNSFAEFKLERMYPDRNDWWY